MDTSKILSGPVSKVELSTDGGNTFTDLGAIGNNNAELVFDPVKYELGDGQELSRFGYGSVNIEVAETDSTSIATIAAAKDTEAQLKITALDGKVYTVAPMLLTYQVKRNFKGDEPHVVVITGKKKFADEDDFVTWV